jgi:serine/threonine protein phosphatase 1
MDMLQRFGRNLRGRDLIVGDIHGNFSGLQAALDAVGFDPAAGDRLFCVGDLVDRGAESDQALEWLAKPWFHTVRGNHEQMAIDYVSGKYTDRRNYIDNGGGWFLMLTRPEQVAFADAFGVLPVAIELETEHGKVGIVHAECPVPEFASLAQELAGERADQVLDYCIWSRARITYRYDDPIFDVSAVVVGHTPMANHTSLGNHLYIDTMGWRPGGHFTLLDAATLKPCRRQGPQ